MNYYDSNYFNSPQVKITNNINSELIWTIIALILAIISGIVLYFTIFNKKNDKKYTGFMKFLYNLVHFQYFVIENIFKILYISSALAITLLSFIFIGKWQFLIVLLGGNLILRISYEFMMLFIELCHNVRNISNKKSKS